MDRVYVALQDSSLFGGLAPEQIREIANRIEWTVRRYARGEVIAVEGEPCPWIGVIIAGSVLIQRTYPSGKTITIDTLGAGSSFGEALIFSDTGSYPVTVVSNQETTVVYLPREGVVRLCAQSPVFLENFLRMLSNRILMLNERIKGLSYQTVRQKVANFILEEFRRQGITVLELRHSRGEMADALGIPQPSLSRELAAMKAEGMIDFERKTITLLDLPMLERSLET
jgi:CRP-like cAMP-binding protein